MKSDSGAGPLVFKISIALGFILGLVLFAQAISTYVDVTASVSSQTPAKSRDIRSSNRTALVDFRPSFNSHSKPTRLELALYFGGIANSVQSLRRNLIVEVSASLALIGAVLILALRFPHYVHGRKIQRQADLARLVQADLLPPRDFESAHFEFASECLPAGDVGGDFCDVFRIEGGETAFVLGDVSGKGIPAALLMALIHGAIHSMSWAGCAEDHETATRSLNALLCRKTAKERFSTLFWGYYDPKTSVLRYINAGHLPPLLIRSDEFGSLQVQRLDEGGPVLGVLPEARYTQGQLTIRKGDLLVAFSDGILEATNSAGEEFGDHRLLDAIRYGWQDTAEGIRNLVLERVKAFANPREVNDDRTMFAVRFQHSPEQAPALVSAPGEKCCLVAL